MTPLPLSRDAATVVGLAGASLAFAQSTDEEVERWLRPLRLYGEAGAILQALAIGEAPLTAAANGLHVANVSRPDETLAAVTAAAAEFAAQRGDSVIGTVDILVAVLHHYPDALERALQSRGSDRWELVERLAGILHAPLREPPIG
jgi:hypothetical protein